MFEKRNCEARRIAVGAALTAVLFLSGCGAEGAVQTSANMVAPGITGPAEYGDWSPAPENTFRVSFLVDGQEIDVQEVPEERPLASVPEVSIPGLIFGGWENEIGELTEPLGTLICGDTTYIARLYPDLRSHVPYLFPDEDGAIRPDDALTADDLAAALNALVVPGGEEHLPGMPLGDYPLTGEVLSHVLAGCFPGSGAAELSNLESVTRAEFARTMNALLARGGERVSLSDDVTPFPDLALNREDAEDILEAALAHTPDENGEILLEGLLGRNWAPGFFHIAGYLYYADEAGNLLRDTDYGSFHFLPDGRYTSGDEELDALVAELLAGWIAETPEAEGDALLQKAYLYVRDMTYSGGNHYDFGAVGWDVEEGKKILSNHHNNCYGYAGAFCALARGLGYDAWCISGKALAKAAEHAWVEAEIDGTTYVFDPQQENRRIEQGRGKGDFEMYMMSYTYAADWFYIRPSK